jgi:hypothetical protein
MTGRIGRGQKAGAANQSRSSNPTKGATERTLAAAPFGAEPGRFCSFKGRTAQVGRFEEANPCSRMVRIVSGPGAARSLLWSKSPRTRVARPRHDAEAQHLAMLLDRERCAKEETVSTQGAGARGLARLLTWGSSSDPAALNGPDVVHPHFLAVFLAAGLIRPARRCKLVASPALRGLSHDRRSGSPRSGPRTVASRPRGPGPRRRACTA